MERELNGLRTSPPPGVFLEGGTTFDATEGNCVVLVRCLCNSSLNAAAAAEERAEGSAESFVLAIDIGLASRYPFEVPTVAIF